MINKEEEYEDATIKIEGQVEQQEGLLQILAENAVRLLMGVKNISLSYSQTDGTELPGFTPASQVMGVNRVNGRLAPTLPFIMGWQNENFAQMASDYGWITNDPNLSNPFLLTHNENLNLRATIEPFRGMRIDLTATRTLANSSREYWVANQAGEIMPYGLQEQGNFSMSFLSINTAFDNISQDNNYQSISQCNVY